MRRAVVTAGAAVARLHAADVPDTAAHHSAEAEAEVSRRWLALAASHGLLSGRSASAAAQAVRRGLELLDGSAERLSVLHRDLHDKQVLVDTDEVGLLDFDLVAAGEPSLDVANLLVHLELRAHQGLLAPDAARNCADALLSAYGASSLSRPRMTGYGLLSRARLVAVYAFRPRGAAAAEALLGEDPGF